MDCEKFDEHVMDALYGELDELSLAALRRHVDGCARCAAIWSGLSKTREAAILPLEAPSEDLLPRILEGERAAARRAPWHRKALRAAAWAGSHAMRPQLAMAALFMLVVGSSLLLLRARPGTVAAPVEVTERGAPTRDKAAKAEAAPASPPAAAAPRMADADGPRDDGSEAKRARTATAAASEPVAEGTSAGPQALEAPRAGGDCASRLAELRARAAGDDAGARAEAEKELAACERELAVARPAAKPSAAKPSAPATGGAAPPAATATPKATGP